VACAAPPATGVAFSAPPTTGVALTAPLLTGDALVAPLTTGDALTAPPTAGDATAALLTVGEAAAVGEAATVAAGSVVATGAVVGGAVVAGALDCPPQAVKPVATTVISPIPSAHCRTVIPIPRLSFIDGLSPNHGPASADYAKCAGIITVSRPDAECARRNLAPWPADSRVGMVGGIASRHGTEDAMHSAPLATRLRIPPLPDRLIHRARLVAALEDGVSRAKLTLVSAPAGYGKTTLLAQWAHATRLPVVWLSLAATENEAERFFRCLVAAWVGIS
jgi:hypothetical protein